MLEHWPAFVFGWPSAFGGAALLVLGLITRRSWFAGAGAIVSAGFCLYLAMNPFPSRVLGLVALAGNVSCPFAIRRGRLLRAALLVLPFFATAAVLLYALANQ